MKILFCLLLLIVPYAFAQDSKSKAGHTHDILEVKFNSDATKLLSYSAGDGWLILWDVKAGRVLWQTKTNSIQKGDEYYTLSCFAFSPDQALIVSGSGNGTVQLWDATTGKLLWRSDAHNNQVTAVGFSPDGKVIASASSSDAVVNLLRIEDGQIIKKLQGNPCTVIALRFDENNKFIWTGSLGGIVSQWDMGTGKQVMGANRDCGLQRAYEWEAAYTSDLKSFAVRSGEKEVTLNFTRINEVRKKFEADGYRIYSRLSADGQKLVISGYEGFTFYDLTTGAMRKIESFSRTGSTIDLSQDGNWFAEGGSWGNAAIKITETKTGKSVLLDGRGQRLPPYQLSELEIRLSKEQEQKRTLIKEAQARRDEQAAMDAETFNKQVYISFEHYGDMADPGSLRLLESDAPNKSTEKRSVTDASAVWLRLHNDSPLPIKIPTQSLYLPNPKCFYEYANGKKLPGLCDGREIYIWHGLEDKKGKGLPYGGDFGSSSVLLPHTSVLFPVPLELLKNEQAIRFRCSFLKETEENKIKEYGTGITLKFRRADLP